MTLIITELSVYGIAMVADSAVTKEFKLSSRSYHTVLNGVRKLQYVEHLNAGVSAWGLGEIEVGDRLVPTEIWLDDFIFRHQEISSLDEFANELAGELRTTVGDMKIPLGFHLAGFVENGSKNLPTFYHVRNVEGTYKNYQFHEFIPGNDMPPRKFEGADAPYLTRNGDYGPYAILFGALDSSLVAVERNTGITIPHLSLEGRVKYHAAWLRFISDLYASTTLLRTIGGPVSGLGITQEKSPLWLPEPGPR